MHLTSTLDPLSTSAGNVPIAIFSFGEQRKLLRVSDSYRDMLNLVAESFDLEEDDVEISLRTSTIDVLQGKEVEIDESAYAYVRPCLGQVDISIVERSQVGKQAQKRRAISPDAPESPSSRLKNGLDEEDSLMTSSTIIYPDDPLDKQTLGTSIPNSIDKGIGGSSKVADMTGGKVDHSPKSKKHTIDEHSFKQLEAPQDKIVPLKIVDLRPITQSEDNGDGASSSQKKSTVAGALFPKFNKVIGSPVAVKAEIIPKPANEESVKPNIIATPSEEDPRFEITIIGPHEETAQFKTRGKHPVRKVLQAACKTFDIKYQRARLILSVSTDDGGEIQTHEFDCPAEETMSQCGVDGNAKLFVRVEPDHDDEELEYEDD